MSIQMVIYILATVFGLSIYAMMALLAYAGHPTQGVIIVSSIGFILLLIVFAIGSNAIFTIDHENKY